MRDERLGAQQVSLERFVSGADYIFTITLGFGHSALITCCTARSALLGLDRPVFPRTSNGSQWNSSALSSRSSDLRRARVNCADEAASGWESPEELDFRELQLRSLWFHGIIVA
jgi:hypothetical protein